MSFIIKERATGEIIASGNENDAVRVFEGNWYFKSEVVNMDHLRVTERTYTCPYKGICYWIDIEAPDGVRVQNIGWVYRQPKPGYEFIKDEIGFYARPTQGTLADKTGAHAKITTASLAK
jgi:uncharacterized protein (DUF427 family)